MDRRCFPGIVAFLSVFVLANALLCISGCTEQQEIDSRTAVITAGTITIDLAAFSRELETKLSSYPYDIKENPEDYNAMVLDLVSDLADEAVLLAAAAAQDIEVSPEELDAAVAEFKKDYPEDSFDKMLLERAILYPVWKKSLKKDMVIQKLIGRDLVDVQEIHPQDMIAFYGSLAGEYNAQDNTSPGDMDEKELVQQLRLEKSRKAFETWMLGLKQKYPVQINQYSVTAFLINQE